ncbi:ABC transporter F family member 4-like isoform X2 [Salvia splendens]|uniref:ABC transporter F family member 4-like isoform X2 n=1 Tax=Salvia splendens TaxID=180675 RepID=UPI001C27215C|nr:ABC transporter F family member 4-like isoform X2 [Salvia splendens]
MKMKEKSSKDDSGRVHRDSASGEKRKVSSQLRECKDSKDLSGHGNGDALEEYVSSKRRKEKTDVAIGGDRWNGGGDERGDGDRNVEKDNHKGENLKVDSKGKENSGKGESFRVDSKSKSKRNESGNSGERKEDILTSSLVDREESKSKGESKRKSERDSSARKEGLKDKEKSGGQETKSSDAEVKIVELNIGKKQGPLPGDFIEERQGTRARENTEPLLDEVRCPELEKDIEKRIRRKREGSSEREKHYDDAKEGGERRSSSKGDRTKDIKYRDDKHKDGAYTDKYQDDGYKEDRWRDEKYHEEADKEYKYQDDKYREDGEKDSRRRDDRHRESDRDIRRKEEKRREDGERDSRAEG